MYNMRQRYQESRYQLTPLAPSQPADEWQYEEPMEQSHKPSEHSRNYQRMHEHTNADYGYENHDYNKYQETNNHDDNPYTVQNYNAHAYNHNSYNDNAYAVPYQEQQYQLDAEPVYESMDTENNGNFIMNNITQLESHNGPVSRVEPPHQPAEEAEEFEIQRLTIRDMDKHRGYLLYLNKDIQTSLAKAQVGSTSEESKILNVWSSNLDEAISRIEQIVEQYPYVAIDTEFPGVISRPMHTFPGCYGTGYRLIADNVNLMKLIQLGLTFYNEKGETPTPYSTYQFNFEFDIGHDKFAPDSIQMLIRSGIDFDKLQKRGIAHSRFARRLMMCGLIINEDVTWICFHGSYDFAYLIRTLCGQLLPEKKSDFQFYLGKYFRNICDLKILLRNVQSMKGGGLQLLANRLNVKRVGTSHMAGSDSLLTGNVFFKLHQDFFEQDIDTKKHGNTLFGMEEWDSVY